MQRIRWSNVVGAVGIYTVLLALFLGTAWKYNEGDLWGPNSIQGIVDALTTGSSGDVTASTAGVYTIGAKAVTASKIALASGKLFVGQSSGAALAVTPSGVIGVSTGGVATLTLASGKVYIGQSTGNGLAVTPSGDATVSTGGVVTVSQASLASGKMWVGQSGGKSLAVTPSGDASVSTGGVVTVSQASLASGKMWIGQSGGKSLAVTPSGDASVTTGGVFTVSSVGGVTLAAQTINITGIATNTITAERVIFNPTGAVTNYFANPGTKTSPVWLYNSGAAEVILLDTGNLKLAGNMTLGQDDTATLIPVSTTVWAQGSAVLNN